MSYGTALKFNFLIGSLTAARQTHRIGKLFPHFLSSPESSHRCTCILSHASPDARKLPLGITELCTAHLSLDGLTWRQAPGAPLLSLFLSGKAP